MRIIQEIFRGKTVTHHWFRGRLIPLADRFAAAVSGLFRRSRGGTVKSEDFAAPSASGGAAFGSLAGDADTTPGEFGSAVSGQTHGSAAGTLVNSTVTAGAYDGILPGSSGGTAATSAKFGQTSGGAEYGAVGGGAFASGGMTDGAAGCASFAGSLAGTEVDSVEVIAAGVYSVTPPQSFEAAGGYIDVPNSVTIGGVEYETPRLILGPYGMTAYKAGSPMILKQIAYRSEDTGYEWVKAADTVTVTESTPVTVDDYAVFATYFTMEE